jgi:hypothetical protein
MAKRSSFARTSAGGNIRRAFCGVPQTPEQIAAIFRAATNFVVALVAKTKSNGEKISPGI